MACHALRHSVACCGSEITEVGANVGHLLLIASWHQKQGNTS
jgi:hypothetical protein